MHDTHISAGPGPMRKPRLSRIAVFGANGRVGCEVANAIIATDPSLQLRLIGSTKKSAENLQLKYSNAEVFEASYYDVDSLRRALADVDGVFLITPNRLDEEWAMPNFVRAAREVHGQIKHIVRILGDPPGMTIDRVPDILRDAPGGIAIQHILAKSILAESRLPITYVNVAAYFMQNLSGPLFSLGLRKYRTFACPRNRRMSYIDTVDIGRCCAAILQSNDHRHIGQTYHLDNGIDVLRFDEVADLMTEVWGEEIIYDGRDETFVNLKYTGELDKSPDPPLEKEDYWVSYCKFEERNQTAWRKTDIVEYLTGQPAKSLRDWLAENKKTVLESTETPRVY